jgi:hypothetical protein
VLATHRAAFTATSVHSNQRAQQPAFTATSVRQPAFTASNDHAPLQRAAIASSSTTPPSFHQRHRLHMRDVNVTFINTTITLIASSNRFELNDFSPPLPTTSTSHEHVKGWSRPLRDSLRAGHRLHKSTSIKGWSRTMLRDSLRAQDIDFTRARQGVEQTAPRFTSC